MVNFIKNSQETFLLYTTVLRYTQVVVYQARLCLSVSLGQFFRWFRTAVPSEDGTGKEVIEW